MWLLLALFQSLPVIQVTPNLLEPSGVAVNYTNSFQLGLVAALLSKGILCRMSKGNSLKILHSSRPCSLYFYLY